MEEWNIDLGESSKKFINLGSLPSKAKGGSKHEKIIIVLAAMALATAFGGCRKENRTITTPREDAISRETLDTRKIVGPIMSSSVNSLSPVQLIESNEVVYIEGITEDEAKTIDRSLRYFEENLGKKANPASDDGDIAWFYNPTRHILKEWFDPNFDLPKAIKSIGPSKETRTMDWLIHSSDWENLESEGNFYFKKDEELGGYRMSNEYFPVRICLCFNTTGGRVESRKGAQII